MSHRSPRLVLAVLATLALACGKYKPGSGQPDAFILFENQSISQADVYARGRGGGTARLGTVYPGRTEALRVRATSMGGDRSLNVVARLFASNRAPSSGFVTLMPGDSLRVTLSSDGAFLSVLPPR